MGKISKWSFGDWFLAFIGGSVALVFVVAMAGKIGLIKEPFPPVVKTAESPVFDNKECLQRNQYRVRENDPLITDDEMYGMVARACVVEKSEFYGR